jgi:hypothetical protein
MKLLVNLSCYVELDEEDVPLYLAGTWRETKKSSENTSYIIHNKTKELLHRALLQVSDPGIQVDHIDGNGLNNKRSNLKLVSNRANAQNNSRRRQGITSSKYLGVTKSHSSWRVRVWTKDSGHICLGTYESEEEAALVYDNYMKKHFTPETRGSLNFE